MSIKRRLRFITVPLAIGLSILIASIPVTLLFLFWSWCMAQISASGGAAEFAGVLKVLATIVIVVAGGGPVLFGTVLFGIAAVGFLAAVEGKWF